MSTLSLVALQMGGGQMGNGMGPGGWGFGYGFAGLAAMLLLLGVAGYFLVRAFGGGGTPPDAGRRETPPDAGRSRSGGGDDPALAELRERYARGEIDDEEFERRARRLRGDSDST